MTASFDWNQFPKMENEPSKEPSAESKSTPTEMDWNQFPAFKEEHVPSAKQEVKRHTLRTSSRVAETLLGIPGDILNAPSKVAKFIHEKISGKPQPEYDEVMKMARLIIPGGNAPTSEELRGKTKELSEGYLEPKTKGEELSDTLISDFASLAVPIKGKIPFMRALGISLGSNLAEKGAETLGAGETAQRATKMGSMFLLSAFKPNGAKKYADELYQESKRLIPQGATISAQNLTTEIDALTAQLKKGGTAPYKTGSLRALSEIESKVQGGRIPVDELTQFKIDINNARSSLYADNALDKAGRAMAKRNLDSTAKIVDDALKDYGQINPAWEEVYRPANEVYGAIAQSKKVGNSISRLVKQNPHSTGAVLAAELFLAPKTIPIAAGGYGLLKTGELLTRIARSKTLQGYYTDVVNAALKEDSPTMIRYLNKLDAGLRKEQKPQS